MEKLKRKELVRICKSLNLKANGKNSEIIQRIQAEENYKSAMDALGIQLDQFVEKGKEEELNSEKEIQEISKTEEAKDEIQIDEAKEEKAKELLESAKQENAQILKEDKEKSENVLLDSERPQLVKKNKENLYFPKLIRHNKDNEPELACPPAPKTGRLQVSKTYKPYTGKLKPFGETYKKLN